MKLRRYHGLGNDYHVLESSDRLDPSLVRALCDRHTGVGGDGILQPLPLRGDPAGRRSPHREGPVREYAVRIWNPDGSLAEKSGNGLRILARWLRDWRRAPSGFSVEVRLDASPGERVHCVVEGPRGAGQVTVRMGRARFEPPAIPCAAPLEATPVTVLGRTLSLTAVGTGNPHCVVFLDDPAQLDGLPWRRIGAALETHPLFPNRTNVQFAAVISDDGVRTAPTAPSQGGRGLRVAARIWERGAGETTASGSSACAVAAAAVRLGLGEGPVEVVMPGGSLWVEVAEGWQLTLRGPVQEVAAVEVSEAWLAPHRRARATGAPD